MAPILIPQRPGWETVKDTKGAFDCVRIEYTGMVVGFGILAGFIFLAGVADLVKADRPAAFYVLAASLTLLGMSCGAAMRRRQIIRDRRYTTGDIYAILAPKAVSLLVLFAIFAMFCVAHPAEILIFGPWAYITLGLSMPDFRGWWRCLSYLDSGRANGETDMPK